MLLVSWPFEPCIHPRQVNRLSFTESLCPLGLFQDPLVVLEEQLNIFELDGVCVHFLLL